MFKKEVLFILLSFCSVFTFCQTDDRVAYIERYKEIAIKEMERAGVPASIKLAQAIIESNSGKSTLATKARNHFGMKCGTAWKGEKYYHKDDDYDAAGNLIKSCFRVFSSPEASFIAHSQFLRDPKKAYRYGRLFRLDIKDYEGWAYGLKEAGYATNPKYPQILLRIIEQYNLYEYDNMTSIDLVTNDMKGGFRRINDVKVIIAEEGATPASLADKYNVPLKCVIKYNEEIGNPNEKLEKNERVYIQQKRGSYRGKKTYHFVKPGERMYDIAQMYGLRLDKLYKKNRMQYGTEPKEAERIKLRGRKVSKYEKIKLRNPAEDIAPPPVIVPEDEVPDTNDTSNAVYHTVVAGDTLYQLSRKYDTTVDQIMKLNNMTDVALTIGQRLRMK